MAQIYISLGSNINREYHVIEGLRCLAKAFNLTFEQLTLSSLFQCEAVGFNGSAFYNMAIGLECSEGVEQVADILRDIEFSHGRVQNAKKFSPRTLDLDLLLYDDLVIEKPAQLPRDEITKKCFCIMAIKSNSAKIETSNITKELSRIMAIL
jgi:2-amino-4-hydroxy-6-hydroxymethyldihydropteridine diphosphokinase